MNCQVNGRGNGRTSFVTSSTVKSHMGGKEDEAGTACETLMAMNYIVTWCGEMGSLNACTDGTSFSLTDCRLSGL